MLMERGHNDEKQHKHNVLRFTRKNRMSVFLEPNVIRGYAYGFMCNPVWKWIMEKVWPQQYIYRLYTGWVRCHKSWLYTYIDVYYILYTFKGSAFLDLNPFPEPRTCCHSRAPVILQRACCNVGTNSNHHQHLDLNPSYSGGSRP